MADEPRRSGRATKGQYTKERDILEDAAPKRKGKGKNSKAKVAEEEAGDEEDEYIRCICGHYEPEEETERTMICCDSCSAWQHNDCMGLPSDYAPPEYFCEQCRPGDHKELLAAVARGEKPWEEAARLREAIEAEKASKKKKGGKKGRKSAVTKPNDIQSQTSQEVKPSQTPDKDTSAAAGVTSGQKRKLEEPSNGADVQQQEPKKARQASTQAEKPAEKPVETPVENQPETPVEKQPETPFDTKNGVRPPPQKRKSTSVSTPSRQASRSELGQGALVGSADELVNPQRKNAAEVLVKLFIDQTNAAVKQGAYTVPQDQSARDVGTLLGLQVEHAMYHILSSGIGEPNDAYKAQLRTVMFNVKKNPALRDRLLGGSLSPHAFAQMDAADMASKELQQRDAAVKKELEKQHTIIEEQGPRIRRTHKGEEYVDEAQQIASESTVSNAPARRRDSMVEPESTRTKSPDPVSPGSGPMSAGAKPLPFNTQGVSRQSAEPQRKASNNFNIQDVWSSVQGSPDGDRHQFPQLPSHQSPDGRQPPVAPGTQADADIDALLKDEDVESPPYSPKDFGNDTEVVWRGTVNGGPIGKFQATAKYAGGAFIGDIGLSWEQLITAEISIEGRIDPTKADSYLCGLQYSATSDLVIIAIREPEDVAEKENFEKIFTYFKSRNRYGVGVPHGNPAIKDIYLMPAEAGQEKPEVLELLASNKIESPIPERMLIVPFVVKNSELAANATPKDQAAVAASPLTTLQPSASSFHTPTLPNASSSFADSPAPPAGAIPYGQHPPTATAATNSNGAGGGDRGSTTPKIQARTTIPPYFVSTAATAAAQVLGPMASAPAVQQLIVQVPNAGIMEWNVVKEIISENSGAAQDLTVLTNMLRDRQFQPRQ